MAKQKKNLRNQINYKGLILKAVLLLIVVATIGVTYFFKDPIEKAVNYAFNPVLSTDVSESQLKVHFIDVGQGDSIAIELPDGKHMLVDAGTGKSADSLVSYLNNSFFEKDEPKVFDYFIMTHPHEDHIGGAPDIFENFQVNMCIRSQVYTQKEAEALGVTNKNRIYNTAIYNRTIEALKNEPNCKSYYAYENLNLIKGTEISLRFLSPNDDNIYENLNNYSPIMILEYSRKRLMLTGDAEKLVEDRLLELYKDNLSALDIDILKLGHHGSRTSTSLDFYKATSPDVAVISCGKDNSYGHPSKEITSRLSDIESNTYRTDINGNIVIGINNMGKISVSVNYSYQMPFYFSWNHIAISGALVAVIIIFFPDNIKNRMKKRKNKSK